MEIEITAAGWNVLIEEMAKAARPDAASELAEVLLRIYLAHASDNNGTVNGESVLCHHHATQARDALERAGVQLPQWATARAGE